MGWEHEKLQSSTRLLKSGQEEGHVIRADDKAVLHQWNDLDKTSDIKHTISSKSSA